jgi:hypothetical protein
MIGEAAGEIGTYEYVDKTLEEYLRESMSSSNIFSITASEIDGRIGFVIHPLDKNGETMDFTVRGNGLHSCTTRRINDAN